MPDPAAAAEAKPDDPEREPGPDEPAPEPAAGAKKKKKKRKKKKARPLSAWLSLGEAADRGRLLRAREPVPRGQAMMVELPFASVPVDGRENDVCSTCWAPAPAGVSPACADCGRAVWCSEACREAQAALHALECAALAQMQPGDCEPALLRLLTRAVCQRTLGAVSAPQCAAAAGPAGVDSTPTWNDVEGMVHHLEHMTDAWRAAVDAGAERLLPLLPAGAAASAAELLELAARVNANAHGLAPRNDGQVVAVGLFPRCALANHSCLPNAVHAVARGRLELRAVCDVPQGDEVCIRYVDLYQTREARRAQLLAEKHFVCGCVRCASADGPDVEASGALCAGCGVLVGRPGGECPSCGGVGDVARAEGAASDALVRADALEVLGDFAGARAALEGVLAPPPARPLPPPPPGAPTPVRVGLHPRHALQYKARVSLTRVCLAAGDALAAAGYARQGLADADVFFEGRSLPEVLRSRERLCEVLRVVLAPGQARLPPKRRKELQAELRRVDGYQ